MLTMLITTATAERSFSKLTVIKKLHEDNEGSRKIFQFGIVIDKASCVKIWTSVI
jgi:hypothetical protein